MSSHIHKSCVGFEATLSDKKKKYIDKVNALLAGWEHVTNYIASCPESTQSLIEWANEHTLQLVLRGEWPKLAAATKTHLNVTLQRCVALLGQQQQPAPAKRCQDLIELVQNPWAKPALVSILNDHLNSEHEEEEFFYQEKGELLKMRLKILCEDRCEDMAVNLAAACVRSLRRNERLRSLTDPSQVHYMIDVYVVLLYKLKRTQDIVGQLKLMELKDGLELMQRLSGEKPTKYGTARVWRNSMKVAELVAPYLVTMGMIRPVVEVGSDTFEQILNSWALLHAKSKDDDGAAMLPGIVRKLSEPAESAQHIYIFCGVLARHFGSAIKPLVIELYIRALTSDMNELENQKCKANKEKSQEIARTLSQEFLKLADYVHESVGIARECVLTAFSLHPTRECYERIRDLAVACGKCSREEKIEIKVEPEDESRSQDEAQAASTENGMGASMPMSFDTFTIKKEEKPDPTPAEDGSLSQQQQAVLPVITTDSIERRPSDMGSLVQKSSIVDKKGHQEALILIKGDTMTGSANYDEKAVPNQMLDGEKLGVSPQVCDDLAVVLSSQRYHVLTWWLDWKELSELCERYLENAEEMRNTNRELKYLNIDYSQFKDRPYDDNSVDDQYIGIEKGYERWNDSDYSESEAHQQSLAAKATRTQKRSRNFDDSSDTDSEIILATQKRRRPRKVPRLESSESEFDGSRHRRPGRSLKKKVILSSSGESDINTQDSQMSGSLGSDGLKRTSKKLLSGVRARPKKSVTKRRPRKTKLPVDSVKKFHMLVNENVRPAAESNVTADARNGIMTTLFSVDTDENKCETIIDAAQRIISEKRSNPEVIKSLRMFRPHGKKLSQINNEKAEPPIANGIQPKRENGHVDENESKLKKFAPMLSTLNLNPKISLRRVDDKVPKKLSVQQKKRKNKQSVVTAGDLSNELRNIKKSIPFTKSALTSFAKQKAPARRRKTVSPKSDLAKSQLTDILTKTVPGMHSMEFSVLPRVQSTVNVVQLSRNNSQNSPNSASTTTASGNTPPRGSSSANNRSSSTIQLPGTPSSTSGHDSGVGMSPAGQTPPPVPRPSSLQDVGEETNPPPDTSPIQVDSTNTVTLNLADGERTVALAVLSSPRIVSSPSSKKSPSPSTNNTMEQQQQLVLCKPDGTYHLVSPSIVTGQRGILSVQNFEDGNIGFTRQIPIVTVSGSDGKSTQTQTTRNTGLPKFQQAFGKTICALSTESTVVPSSSAPDARDAPAGAASNVQQQQPQQRIVNKSAATVSSNLAKTVPTTAQNVSLANIPNLQVSQSTRQILNLVQSAVSSSTGSGATGQTVQIVPNSTPGVIYTHKIPVSIAGGSTSGTQLISIPASLSNTRSPVQVKLNIIRTAPFRTAGGAIQVLTSRIQQPQQSQAQQPTVVRSTDSLINSTMDIPNQVSSSTLEQLREFESVLEQVKERGISQSTTADTTTVQTQTQTVQSNAKSQGQQGSVNSLTQQLLMQPSQSPSCAVEFPSNVNITFQQQQQEVYSQKVSLMTSTKTNANSCAASGATNASPASNSTVTYCQPAASPALSVTSQSSSSPCVTPAPAATPSHTPTSKSQSSSKSAKKAAPKTVKASSQVAVKTPPMPKTTQQKPQEDPETTQRIYAILGQYAEQLRNSPDLNNKPAPRRRSNPPTNPNQTSKRKKSGSGKSKSSSGQTPEPSPSADDPSRTTGSEDSSGGGAGSGIISGTSGSGLMHIQDSPSASFSACEETLAGGSNNNSQSGTNDNATLGNPNDSRTSNTTSDSNDGVDVTTKRRNIIFSESSTGVANHARAVIVQEAAVQSKSMGEALASVTGKMTTGTAVLVSGTNFMLPMNFVKSGQQITVVSGGSKLLAAVPAVRSSTGASGAVSNTFVLQSLLNQANKVIQQQHQKQQQQAKLAQTSQIIIPQAGSVVRFASEELGGDKFDDSSKSGVEAKSPTIGLLQHSGVITTNPNIGQRIFNSSVVKLPAKVDSAQQTQQVVCLATPAIKEALADTNQKAATIALAFASTNAVDGLALHKKPKPDDIRTAVEETTRPVVVNQKDNSEQSVVVAGVRADSHSQCDASVEASLGHESTSLVAATVPATSSPVAANSSASLDATSQFLIGGGPSSSDSQESASSTVPSLALENSSLDESAKVENGLLCGNARLQEAWDPCEERKTGESSPDTTPWRYIPTNCATMEVDQQLKVLGSDSAGTSMNNSVLQIIDKGQGVEMSSSGVLTAGTTLTTSTTTTTTSTTLTTKKYFHVGINNSVVEPYQGTKFTAIAKGPKVSQQQQTASPRTAAEQENQQRLMERKQQMIERELRLQKSLSEECEDLGVDEPSTSDLFPEADLQLFDANHSPAYDHLSQEATCSQSLNSSTGPKSYGNTNVSFFKSLDPVVTSSAGSRGASPVTAAIPAVAASTVELKRKPQQRRPARPKAENTAKRNKRSLDSADHRGTTMAKQLRLSLDDASNSYSDLSQLSPAVVNNDLVPKTEKNNVDKNRDDRPSSSSSNSSISSNNNNSRPIVLDASSRSIVGEVARRAVLGCNNAVSSTAVSSGEEDESLTLLEDTAANNVTIPSPLSPIAGPLLMTHRYTYSNSKKRSLPVRRASDFFNDTKSTNLNWGSPTSERTRSSSDDEMNDEEENDETSIIKSFVSNLELDGTENSSIGNGLGPVSSARPAPSVKVTPVDHAIYPVKKKTLSMRRITVNHRESKLSSVITANSATKRLKTIMPGVSATLTPATTTTSENESSSPVPAADKIYDMNPSDDEALATAAIGNSRFSGTASPIDHCSTARRSSLRGHVKKGCGCCNGSPERAKPKKIMMTKQPQVQQLQPDGSAAGATVPVTPTAKLKKAPMKQLQQQQQQHHHQPNQQQQQQPHQQQQTKQLTKKR
ncbi:mucin-19 [Copidosoma floridanum]|uniref:mucin-19 n=1 Tax=Copidosoma floridanum TaxID=29053 RepID=UPI0006C95465|nr:mucin-19 [Copidosoma floridanum]